MARCFVECPLHLGLSDVPPSHDETGVMGFWKEHHGGEVPFSSHLIGGTRHSHGITGDVNLDYIIKVVFARSLPCEGEELTFKCSICTKHCCGRWLI